MDHSEIEELLSAYADSELTPAQREAVELHLSACADCQRALAEFRLVGKRLALLADPTVNRWEPDVTSQVAARIQRRRRWVDWGRGLAVRAAGMAAAGAILVGALWLLGHLPAVPAEDEFRASAPLVTRVVAPTGTPTTQPTPTSETLSLFNPLTPLPSEREVAVRLERVYVTPAQPRQGQPFTITAVIRNLGDEEVRVPVWFGAFLSRDDPYPTASYLVYYLTIPASGEAELSWDGQDQWQRNRAEELTREHARLVLRAGVNALPPGGYPRPILFPETDKLDNQAEITVNFLPYEPLVSDACPPGDNLWVELDQGRVYQETTRQSTLRLIVHNAGHIQVVRVPLRITDADGIHLLTFAEGVAPCGGAAIVEEASISADQLVYPITITLNPPDAPGAAPESDRRDNILVVGEYAACTGDTDLWLTDQDVAIDGADLLVTVHLAGQAPTRSFSVHVYHTSDGRLLASERISQITCQEPVSLRFEGILSGLAGGYVMVQIDTEANRVEPVYPQHNNSAIVRITTVE